MDVVKFSDFKKAHDEEKATQEIQRFIIEQFIPCATKAEKQLLIEAFETKNEQLFESLIKPAYMRYYIRLLNS